VPAHAFHSLLSKESWRKMENPMKTQLMTTKCCKCRSIRVNGNWFPEPTFLAWDVIYTHTYCPECFEQEMAMVEKYFQDKPVNAIVCSGNRIIAA